jgi:trans-2-enoyl-CoA reductase
MSSKYPRMIVHEIVYWHAELGMAKIDLQAKAVVGYDWLNFRAALV